MGRPAHQGLSLLTAVKNALFGERAANRGEVIKTLIDEFEYPRLGPGMMWERARDLIEKAGSRVVMQAPVERVEWTVDGIRAVYAAGRRYEGDAFVSSIALRDLVEAMDPPPPAEVLAAARKLRYRDSLTVALIVDAPNLFPDTWIYIRRAPREARPCAEF
ncbi:MAG: FAD-dependent oxidoreductase [Bryobacterales bacterium]